MPQGRPHTACQAAAELAFNSTSAWMDPALVPADAKVSREQCLAHTEAAAGERTGLWHSALLLNASHTYCATPYS